LLASDEWQLDAYRNDAIRLLCIAGLAGFPQVSMPLSTRLGAPLGLSLLGPAGSDQSLVVLAQRLAQGLVGPSSGMVSVMSAALGASACNRNDTQTQPECPKDCTER
jgi:hypothetical protein